MPFDAFRKPIAAAAWLLAAAAASAQVSATARSPDAGRLLQETRPATATPPSLNTSPKRLIEAPTRPTVEMPEGVTVTPSGFRVTGAVSFTAAELAELVKPWVGRKLDLAGLNEAAGAITRQYQSAGHFLSYAYLPAQKVADGVIEIAVLEGRIEGSEVASAPEVRLRDEVVEAYMAPVVEIKPVKQADVERQMLLLNDIPGVVARAAFTPGASPGGAQMVVSVAEDEPLVVDFGLDNYGSPSSGATRLGLGFQFRDLFGLGDDSQARFMVSQRGRLVSGSLGTWVPWGGSGLKVGALVSTLTYSLGGTFADLGATGAAQSLTARASYPLLRSQAANVVIESDLEYKRLRDDLDLVGCSYPKRSLQWRSGVSADARDALGGGGLNSGSLVAVLGDERVLFDFPATDACSRGAQPAGNFKKANLTLAREQVLRAPMSAFVRFAGQFAPANLDSSEKLGLGGPGAVRAYGPGEAVVDDGRLIAMELRWAMEYQGGTMQWSLFRDVGWGRVNINPAAGATGNDVRLSGTGIGLRWNVGELGIAASLAWRGSHLPSAEGGDPSPRIYFQLVYLP